jgi:Domain of unknown function (DUF1877)
MAFGRIPSAERLQSLILYKKYTIYPSMSMCLIYCRVSPRNAKLMQENPELVHQFLDRAELKGLPPERGLLRHLFSKCSSSTVAVAELEARPADDEGDTDNAWHAIHYLLTGMAAGGQFPQSFLLSGGKKIGDEEVGYGPARMFSPQQVALISAELDCHTEETLAVRYDGETMDNELVYPRFWAHADHFPLVWENFRMLRDFVKQTSDNGDYLMLYLS